MGTQHFSERLAALKDSLNPPRYVQPTPEERALFRKYCVIGLIKNKWQFTNYKVLSEWLGCYQYILPDNRELYIPLTQKIFNSLITSDAYSIYEIWYICSSIQDTVTIAEQKEILKWMQESNS